MTAAHAPEWARVVLDDLGLRDWALEWAGRRWVRRNHTHGMAYLDERRIVVAAHCDPHEQLYTLIHEAAHALMDDGAPRYRDDHSLAFYRVLVMLAGFYAFGVDDVGQREEVAAPCICDIFVPCTCDDQQRDRAYFRTMVG